MSAAGVARVKLVADTSKIEAAMREAARGVTEMELALARFKLRVRVTALYLELLPLTEAQATGRFYVRGGMDPAFTRPDQVDAYIQILSRISGPVAAAARDAFLRGWAEHRSVPAEPVVWHRWIGDTRIQIHPEADR